jgi:hypothetical protein
VARARSGREARAISPKARLRQRLQSRDVAHIVVPVEATGALIGTGRCWDRGLLFTGGPWLGRQVAIDLALQQAAEFYDLVNRGRVVPTSGTRSRGESRISNSGL